MVNRHIIVRLANQALSMRIDTRLTLVTVAAVLLAAVGLIVGVGSGDYPIAAFDVIKAVVGAGDADADFIIVTLRLPRVLVALLAGAALGLSGAIFQSLARNPLACLFHAFSADTWLGNVKVPVVVGKLWLATVRSHQGDGHFASAA